ASRDVEAAEDHVEADEQKGDAEDQEKGWRTARDRSRLPEDREAAPEKREGDHVPGAPDHVRPYLRLTLPHDLLAGKQIAAQARGARTCRLGGHEFGARPRLSSQPAMCSATSSQPSWARIQWTRFGNSRKSVLAADRAEARRLRRGTTGRAAGGFRP